MFKTTTLSSFKGILPAIHNQVPLTKRESQQLLDTLTTSFRKHLDKEHGWTPEDVTVTSNLKPALTYLPQSPVASKSTTATGLSPNPTSKEAHRRPTDRHLRAILTNPLFSFGEKLASNGVEKAPVDYFDEAVAKGLMTVRRAHGFLLAVRKDIQQSTSSSMMEGMAASGAGLRVFQWLRSAGMVRDLSFVTNHKFTKLLTVFLVAEGLEDLVWAWMAQLMSGHGPQASDLNMAPTATLLDAMVSAKTQTLELDAAFATMLRAEALARDSSSPMLNLLVAWRHLSWKTTVESWKHSVPSDKLYDPFVDMVAQMRTPMRLERAHLNLHHPSKPDPTLAVKYLHDKHWVKQLPETVLTPKWQPVDAASRKLLNFTTKLMSMGLDTVQHLGRIGEHEEAQRILEILKMYLGAYFDDSAVDMRKIAHSM